MSTIKVIEVTDLGVYIVSLPRGVYVVDGEVVSHHNYGGLEIQCKSTDIRTITTTHILTHYEDAEGLKLTPDEYDEAKQALLDKGEWDIYAECQEFKDLDDEFAYKKFIRKWSAIHRDVVQYSEPIPVEVTPCVVETGNKFITTLPSVAQIDKGLFHYNRVGATADIVNRVFDSLGMEFDGDTGYAKTEGKKIWGNSDHSHLRYVTAFGSYILGDAWDIKGGSRGTLEQCKARYEADKATLNRIIRSKYAAHFHKDANLDVDKLLTMVRGLRAQQSKVRSMKATWSENNTLGKKIAKLEEYLNETLEEATRTEGEGK